MKRLITVAVLLLAATAVFAGGAQEAELGTEENPIVWALVPSGETQAILAGADELVAMLEERTGYIFSAIVAADYSGVIEALSADPPSAHMAALNTFGAILAAERGVAKVGLIAVRRGDPFYGGQFVVAADSGIESVADMAGRTFARPDPNSTSGWIVPSIVMRAAGVNPDTDLAEVVDAGGHSGVISAVYNQSADAGASFVDARSTISEDNPDVNEKVLVLEEFGPIPNDGIQYSTAMPEEMRNAITDAFIDIAGTEEGVAAMESVYEWTDIVRQDDSFYDPFRQVLEAAGVDLSDYLD